MINWIHEVSYFVGGSFLTNAIPHFVSGCMGRPFQSPFAKPPGQGLSTSTVNVFWGFFNMVVSYALIVLVGDFDVRSAAHMIALGLGVLLTGVMHARMFGRLHGGNAPEEMSSTISFGRSQAGPVRRDDELF